MSEQRQGIGCQFDAIGLHARQGSGIQAQIRMAFHFQCAAQSNARALRDFAYEGAAHAPGGAHDGDLQHHEPDFGSVASSGG